MQWHFKRIWYLCIADMTIGYLFCHFRETMQQTNAVGKSKERIRRTVYSEIPQIDSSVDISYQSFIECVMY